MKKRMNIESALLTLFLALCPLFSAWAFLPTPPVGPTPTVDAPGDAALGGESGAKKAKAAIDKYQEKQSEILGQLKSGKIKLPFKFDTSMFHKEKGEPNIPAAMKIEESTVADIKDEDSIIEAFHTLFLKYPADILEKYPLDQQGVKKAYRDKAVEFSNDSMIEMYLTVRSLEERMAVLKAEFSTLSSCYVKGESQSSTTCEGASDTDEELGMWSNYYKLNAVYDSMLKITEELMAIKAQYEVAQAVRSSILPFDPTDDLTEETGGKQETGNDNNTKEESEKVSSNGIYHYISLEKAAYAQLFTAEEAPISQEGRAAEQSSSVGATESVGGIELTDYNVEALKPDPKREIVEAKPYKMESPFAGTADQFKTLAETNNVYLKLKQAKEIHNIKQQLPEYRRIFVEYDKMKQLHQKSVEQLKLAEECVVNYLGNYYKEPEKVWLGSGCHYSGTNIVCNTGKGISAENLKNMSTGDTLCADDKSKICRNYGINNYASRSGFSGWLASAYKTAKAEKVLDLNEEDFAVVLNEYDASNDISNFDEQKENYLSEIESGILDSAWLRPSDEPQIEADNRAQELMAWQIGAEGAKALGSDMRSSTPKWGKPSKAYPIWNDEKYFYDQYLAEKYNNMKLYIRDRDMQKTTASLALRLLDSIDNNFDFLNGITGASLKTYGQGVLNATVTLMDQDSGREKAETELEKVHKETNVKLDNMRSAFKAKIVSLENSKDSVYQNLDSANLALNESKQQYNLARDDIVFAKADTEAQNSVISIDRARRAKSSNYETGFVEEAELAIVEANATISSAEQTAESVLSQIDNKRDAIDELNLRLESVGDNIARSQSDYAANASALEVQNAQLVKNAIDQLEEQPQNLALLQSTYLDKAFKRSSDNNPLKKTLVLEIIKFADGLVQNAREKAMARIDEGYEEIISMGDNRFKPESHPQILDIHRDMIEDIQNPLQAEDISTLAYILLSRGNIASLINEMFENMVRTSICADVNCKESDNLYFVGLMPQEKDFTGPKTIAVTYSAPLREIVHFDIVDYDNVVKSDALMTTRTGFLDYGQEIPEVWKRILEPKGFVERDVDVEKILAENKNASDTLLRGGSYPCSTGKYDIDIKDSGFYVSPASGNRSACTDIRSVNLYFTGKADLMLNNGEKVAAGYGKAPDNQQASELSLLLSYNNGLTFSDKLKDIIDFYDEVEVSENQDSYGIKGKIYEKALLNRNQFGDFLNFMELESEYQKAVDKLEVKVEENRKTLKENFAKFDYVPAEDFDLSDENTYNQIMQALDNGKNKIVNAASSELQALQPLNDVLEEKITKLNNILGALNLDYDELVQISDDDSADSSLSEKIKQKQADKEVRTKYEAEAQEEFEKNLNGFETPYCAVY